MCKEEIKKIFEELDSAIEISQAPVKASDSKFLKKYKEVKEKYLNEK